MPACAASHSGKSVDRYEAGNPPWCWQRRVGFGGFRQSQLGAAAVELAAPQRREPHEPLGLGMATLALVVIGGNFILSFQWINWPYPLGPLYSLLFMAYTHIFNNHLSIYIWREPPIDMPTELDLMLGSIVNS